jgi:NPCBM/NEW2 domain
MLTKPILPLIVLFGFAVVADGQETARFTIDTPTETRSGCALVSLTSAGALTFELAGARAAAPRFVELRQDGSKLPALLTRNFVSLSNGDRLPLDPGASAKLEKSRLHVWPAKSLPGAHAKGLDLFVPHVVLLFWSLPDGIDDAEPFFAKLQEEPRKRDAVYLKNGDHIDGTVTTLSADAGCIVTSDGRAVQTPWSKLAGIAFNTDRQARLRTKKAYLRGVLDGGARVNFLELSFDEKTRAWIGKTQFGPTFELPETSMIAVDVRQDAAVDLADLTPTRYEHRAYLGAAWPLMKDAAVSGQPLRLDGQTYEKGLGTHAACKVVYQLDAKYQRFDAIVGIDEKASKGRARVAIDLDGKRIDLSDGKELTGQTAPITVRLDLKKARTLTLIVEFGTLGDVQAHVNWAKARLIKKD